MPDVEGDVYQVNHGFIEIELDDGRFFHIDVSCLDIGPSGLPRVGDRVKLQAALLNPETLVASSLEVQARKNSPEKSESASPLASTQANPGADDRNIAAVRQYVSGMIKGLPNFLVREQVKRLISRRDLRDFQLLDTISLEVLYSQANGETYRSVRVNGAPSSAEYLRLYGNISAGEFGSMIRSIFRALPDSAFHLVADASSTGKSFKEYSYSVNKTDSDWRIENGYQFIVPAYSGRIRVDDANVLLQVTRTAQAIPKTFPSRLVESSVAYGKIQVAGTGIYNLPARAQMDSCDRATSECNRNLITFDSYRHFTSKSDVKFSR